MESEADVSGKTLALDGAVKSECTAREHGLLLTRRSSLANLPYPTEGAHRRPPALAVGWLATGRRILKGPNDNHDDCEYLSPTYCPAITDSGEDSLTSDNRDVRPVPTIL